MTYTHTLRWTDLVLPQVSQKLSDVLVSSVYSVYRVHIVIRYYETIIIIMVNTQNCAKMVDYLSEMLL